MVNQKITKSFIIKIHYKLKKVKTKKLNSCKERFLRFNQIKVSFFIDVTSINEI